MRLTVLCPVDHAHRGVENVLTRTIILLQQDGLRIGKVLLKALDVAPIRATPGIDRLIGVPNHKYILIKRSEFSDKRILRQVRILEFIHQHMAESLRIFVTHTGIFFEQAGCVQKDVVEIHGIAGDESLLISLINAFHDFVAIGCGWILIGSNQLILGA